MAAKRQPSTCKKFPVEANVPENLCYSSKLGTLTLEVDLGELIYITSCEWGNIPAKASGITLNRWCSSSCKMWHSLMTTMTVSANYHAPNISWQHTHQHWSWIIRRMDRKGFVSIKSIMRSLLLAPFGLFADGTPTSNATSQTQCHSSLPTFPKDFNGIASIKM